MKAPVQPELFASASNPLPEHEVAWLIAYLRGKDWRTSTQVLIDHGMPNHESTKRRLRAIASGSSGRIAGGQAGYRLVEEMTREEYNHWRNWLTSQADEMRLRVVKSDKVFYARAPVPSIVKGPMPEFSGEAK